MKLKSFVVAGVIAAAVSPVRADVSDFKVTVDKDGKVLMDQDSARLAKALEAYNAALKLSDDIKKERTKCISAGNFWYDGKCVSKNPCTSKNASDKQHCITKFKDVQVATETRAANIVKTYVTNILKWDGCAEIVVPKSKAIGQDYIRCVNTDGNIRVFEFDDMSESNNRLADSNYAYAMCLALGGTATFPKSGATSLICNKVNKQTCEDKLDGAMKDGKCNIAF